VIFQDFLPDDLAMIDLLGAIAGEWSSSTLRPSPS
jgi:hypothetical protein